MIRPDIDKAIVVSFDTGVDLIAAISPATRRNWRSHSRPCGPAAALRSTMRSSTPAVTSSWKTSRTHKFRRALIILGDGEDNQSRYSRDQALEMAHRADAVVYTISTNISRIQTNGDKVLKYFAEETGGLALFPFKVEDLEQSFETSPMSCGTSTTSSTAPSRWSRTASIIRSRSRFTDQTNLVVRARRGYYAPRCRVRTSLPPVV